LFINWGRVLYLWVGYLSSRAFTKGESNKSTTEQELAAIHWEISHFRPYIYGKHFTRQGSTVTGLYDEGTS